MARSVPYPNRDRLRFRCDMWGAKTAKPHCVKKATGTRNWIRALTFIKMVPSEENRGGGGETKRSNVIGATNTTNTIKVCNKSLSRRDLPS